MDNKQEIKEKEVEKNVLFRDYWFHKQKMEQAGEEINGVEQEIHLLKEDERR